MITEQQQSPHPEAGHIAEYRQCPGRSGSRRPQSLLAQDVILQTLGFIMTSTKADGTIRMAVGDTALVSSRMQAKLYASKLEINAVSPAAIRTVPFAFCGRLERAIS